MRHIPILLLFLLIASCRKDSNSQIGDPSMRSGKTEAYLKSQLSGADYQALDFSKADLATIDTNQLWRIPFTGKSIATDFVLVRADASGNCTGGRIIHFENGLSNGYTYNGTITIQSLVRQPIIQSDIVNGFIETFHPSHVNRITTDGTVSVDVVPASAGADILPEVVIVGYINSTGTEPSLAQYMMLMTLMASSPNGGGGATDTGGAGSTAGVGSGGSTANVIGSPVSPSTSGNTAGIYSPSLPNGGTLNASLLTKVAVEPEYTTSLPVIDISAYFKCFDNVPSAGATFTVKLSADIPVNSSPDIVTTGVNSGHSFLTVTKTNGANTVSQSYGFYPAGSISILNPFSVVPGGVKDNGGHEINASISMQITEAQFDAIKTNSINLATNAYSLAGFNCTNYALNVFNSVRTAPIAVAPLTVYLPSNTSLYNPAATPPTVSIPDSPQSLFVKLQSMKTSGSSEAGNIVIDQTSGTKSALSHGACN